MSDKKGGTQFLVMLVTLLVIAGFVVHTRGGAGAIEEAHRIASDMSNIRACTFAYYSDTNSWPKSLDDIKKQLKEPIRGRTNGISVVDDGGALFVRYNGLETGAIAGAHNKVADELAVMKDADMLFSKPTADPKAAPDYDGGTDVYMLIKTANYNPNTKF